MQIKPTEDWRHQPRGRYNITPPPNLVGAIAAYKAGEKTPSIVAAYGVGYNQLYRWLERMGVRQRGRRENYVRRAPAPILPIIPGKAGRPLKQPKVLKCGWCKELLSPSQVARRRKYCCRQCQNAAIAAASARPCPAPGCAAAIRDDSPYCSWACFQAVMGARFG
jgi:hypothetical protein